MFLDVDRAFEISAIFNGNTLGRDIAVQGTRPLEFHALAGGDVAVYSSVQHQVARRDGGLDLPIRPYHQLMIAQVDSAFDLSIEIQIFVAGKLSANHY